MRTQEASRPSMWLIESRYCPSSCADGGTPVVPFSSLDRRMDLLRSRLPAQSSGTFDGSLSVSFAALPSLPLNGIPRIVLVGRIPSAPDPRGRQRTQFIWRQFGGMSGAMSSRNTASASARNKRRCSRYSQLVCETSGSSASGGTSSRHSPSFRPASV